MDLISPNVTKPINQPNIWPLNTTLCFDFGNTRQKCGIFRDGVLQEVLNIPDGSPESIREILAHHPASRSILASVIDHDPAIETLLAQNGPFHKLSAGSLLPFTTPVGKPETIGADRLALAAAAVHFHQGRHNLVIGLGSCITYNFINKFGSFIGGSISPGKEMRFRAMHTFTAKLPWIETDGLKPLWEIPLMGYDTRSNLLSGVVYGMASEIDGIIAKYQEKFRNFNVILTGGDAAYITRLLSHPVHCDPDLLFKGLYAICEVNLSSTNFGGSHDENR